VYDTSNASIILNENDKINWKRNVSTKIKEKIGTFTMSGSLSASGNIMSLLSNNY